MQRFTIQDAWPEVSIDLQVITLLLHQFRLAEALAQFKAHMSLFRQTPFESQPAFAAAHWGWVSRQYAAMGELMTSRTDLAALKVLCVLFKYSETSETESHFACSPLIRDPGLPGNVSGASVTPGLT